MYGSVLVETLLICFIPYHCVIVNSRGGYKTFLWEQTEELKRAVISCFNFFFFFLVLYILYPLLLNMSDTTIWHLHFSFCLSVKMIISVLKKKVFLPFFTRYLTFRPFISSNEEKAHHPLFFQENRGIVLYIFTRKTKVSSYKHWHGIKSKIVMFAGQHITEFNPFYIHVTQYTRPNLPWSY